MLRDGRPLDEGSPAHVAATSDAPAATRDDHPAEPDEPRFLTIDDLVGHESTSTGSPAPTAPTTRAAVSTPPPQAAATPPAPPTIDTPQPIVEHAATSEPEPDHPDPSEASTTPPSNLTASGAASQIAELLRAAHDSAARLRQHAEVEVKHSVEAARAEVNAHKQRQLQVLEAEQAAAEQLQAEIIHAARLAATELQVQAEEEAAQTRAAARAVLAQATAEAHAAKAIAEHNLAEIEAAQEETAARGAEMLGVGSAVLASIESLDESLRRRITYTDQVLGSLRAATRPMAS